MIEFNGVRNEGFDAVREAFRPQFEGAFGEMKFSADGESVFLSCDAESEFKQLARVDLKTMSREEVERFAVEQVGASTTRGREIYQWAWPARPPRGSTA